LTRTVADAAIILQAIAGYGSREINSRMFTVPDYSAALRSKTSALRLGIPREFFFADLHPEIEAAIQRAIAVLSYTDVAGRHSAQEFPATSPYRCTTELQQPLHYPFELYKTRKRR
jgi:aspartyl-tRNA(Asn)/glutamyl-tRNA(Gln) amidotransferase subunit A